MFLWDPVLHGEYRSSDVKILGTDSAGTVYYHRNLYDYDIDETLVGASIPEIVLMAPNQKEPIFDS